MFNRVWSWKTFNLSKKIWPVVLVSGLALMGQSCSISIGSSQPLDGGIYRSDDHGLNWQAKNFVRQEKKRTVNLGDVTGLGLFFHPRQPETLYLGTRENGIWLTTNGGQQWQATSLRAGAYQCIDFDPINPDVMYTASGTLVLKSVDGGQSWKTIYTESQPAQSVTCLAVDKSQGNRVWLVTSGGKIIRSDDYGQTWTLKQSGGPFQPRQLWVDPGGAGRLYVFTQQHGVLAIEKDGSERVDLSPPPKVFRGGTDIRAVAIKPGRETQWWLATAAGLLTSTDRGNTWTMIKTLVTAGSVAINSVAVNPKNQLDVFITTSRKLHHTTDGGLTWTVTTLPTSRLPVHLTFAPNDSDRLYFATYRPPKKDE